MVETMRDCIGPEQLITEAVRRAVGRKTAGTDLAVEKPENPAHGDYATNVAMKLAPALQRSPMKTAGEVSEKLRADEQIGRLADRIEVAPPGFVNLFLSSRWLADQIPKIIAAGATYGRPPFAIRHKSKVQIEFISANPTGPLTLANGRGGFLGDALANVLEAAGHRVTREYYVNDAGEQVRKLGASVLRAKGYAVPYPDEELYRGAYIVGLAEGLDIPAAASGEEASAKLVENIARQASQDILRDIKRVTRKAGIRFDAWFSERSLYRQGFVEEALKALKRKRLVEEREGALWLKLSELADGRESEGARGREGEKVVVKSSGEPTYVLPDIAYHEEKFRRRKFDRVIDIWGADHHGHARVLTAALHAFGLPAPDVILMQLVRLVENGREVKMSKRTGSFVTLEELLEEVGQDVARWFFLERAPQTHMEFDLSLAKERSEKNPVFYAQYAHVRCASILRKAAHAKRRKSENRKMHKAPPHPSERALMLELVRLPDLVARISRSYEVHHLTTYATAVAAALSAFYRDCPVLTPRSDSGRTDDGALRASRLELVRATKTTLENTLGLMGIRAPERM